MDTLKNNSREKTFSCLYQAGETTHEFKNWRSADWSLLSLFWKHKERKWERSVWFSLMLILFIVLLKKILRCSIQHCFIVSIWIVLNKVLLIGVFFCASSVSQNLCRPNSNQNPPSSVLWFFNEKWFVSSMICEDCCVRPLRKESWLDL